MVHHGTDDAILKKALGSTVILPMGWVASSTSTLFSSGAGPKVGNGHGQITPSKVTKVNVAQLFFDSATKTQTFNGLTRAEDSSGYVDNPLGNCWDFYTPLSAVTSGFGGTVKTS